MAAKPPKLAPRVYWNHGAYYYVSRENKWIRLGVSEAEAYEALSELHTPSRNMHAVFDRYAREILPGKARKTQKEQTRQLASLRIVFGHMEPGRVKPVHVAEFHDAMGRTAPVSANRHKALLSDVFKFAVRIGAVELNPCSGVARHTEQARERYVSDEEFTEVYLFAPGWLRTFMDLARLTGQRQANLIALSMADLTDDCIRFPAAKRGKKIELEWSEELSAAVARAKAHRATFTGKNKVTPLNLLLNARGQKLNEYGLRSAWRRLWDKYGELVKDSPVEHFTMHDLRAKAGSDSGDDRMLGHQNPAVFRRVYMRKPMRVKPSK